MHANPVSKPRRIHLPAKAGPVPAKPIKRRTNAVMILKVEGMSEDRLQQVLGPLVVEVMDVREA